MQLKQETVASGVVGLALVGRLDAWGVDQQEAAFMAALGAAGCDVLLDLSQTSFLSSMGVRLLLAAARAQKAAGRQLVVFGAAGVVQGTLEMVAFDQIVPVCATQADALARLGAAAV